MVATNTEETNRSNTDLMKHTLSLFLLVLSLNAFSQEKADAIVGKWLKIPKEDLIIEVFKADEIYKGKIDWSANTEKKPAGFVILQQMKYNEGAHVWEHGKITDPSSGKSYSAIARIKADGTLEVQGYMGMKFLGSKRYFKRVK